MKGCKKLSVCRVKRACERCEKGMRGERGESKGFEEAKGNASVCAEECGGNAGAICKGGAVRGPE